MTSRKGRLWRMDANGSILNDASIETIKPPYDAMIADAVAVFTSKIANDIHSIYVTGSVARGLAVEGVSNLNIFAVLTEETDADLVLQDWIQSAEEELLAQYPSLSDVVLELWPYNHVFSDPGRFSIGAFIIKTHSICVWGSDVAPELPEYKVEAAVANDDLVQIRLDIDEAVAKIKRNSRPENVSFWCRDIAKHILHAGFALVMVDEGIHTRDLDLSYEYFAKHYPGHAADMQRALIYAENPSMDAMEVLDYLAIMGAWMIAHADSWLDQHNPDRELALQVESEEET
jgi:uncharacterized protein